MEEITHSMDDFSAEMADFDVKKVGQFDRMWKVGVGGSVCEKMCLYEGKVYFGSANMNVYCLDAVTGKDVWKFKTDGIVLISSPVISEGILYIGSYDKNLYALDADTGNLIWKFATQGEIATVPAVYDGIVYFGSRDHHLYALEVGSGKLIWKFLTQNEVNSAPTVHNEKVYIGSFDRNLYCLDAKTGRQVWKFETQDEIFCANGPLVLNDTVYFPSFDSVLRAVDANTGQLKWKLVMGQYGLDEAPVYHETTDRMYMGTREGYFACISLDGKFVWKFRMSAVSDTTMACFYKDKIYVGSGDYNLYCLTHEGKEVWKFKTNGPNWWYPVEYNGNIIFCSWDCNIYSVDAETGKDVWRFKCAGSPSSLGPPHDIFELEFKVEEKEVKDSAEKRYEFNFKEEEHNISAYKSRITYQVSTQYAAKGKYQIDSDEEEF